MQRKPTKRSSNRVFWLLVMIAVIVVVGYTWYHRAIGPVSKSNQAVKVTLASGESVSSFANDLQQRQLIRSATAFIVYDKLHPRFANIQAGTYALRPNMGVPDILQIVASGQVVLDSKAVTIPEGYDIQDIAQTLQAEDICSASAFLTAVKHDAFNQSFLSSLTGRLGVTYPLEGFLFPDTYDFTRHENPDDVINEMLNDFVRRVMTQSNIQAMKADGLTLNQVITEASLVQNEAQVEVDRPLIASVINNRLKLGMPLQIDATVDYALGHHVTFVTDAETQNTKSPYNTYLVTGLPPGPIDSPGLESIEAVLHPAKTNYLYYVARGDGSGRHYFAQTYAQQLHNEQLRLQNLKRAAAKAQGSH